MSDDSEESLSLGESDSDSGDLSDSSKSSTSPIKKKPRVTSPSTSKVVAKRTSPNPNAKNMPKLSSKSTSAAPHSSVIKSTGCSSSSSFAPAPGGSGVDVITSSGDITRGAPVTTDVAAKKLIGQYLRQQNRPYSAIQIHDNLHKRVQKGTIERVLTSMCAPGAGFICKEYGKAKIYFIDQNTLQSDTSAGQLEELQRENDDLKAQVASTTAEERAAKAELIRVQAEPADTELKQLLSETAARVNEKRKRVERLTMKSTGVGAGAASTSNGGRGNNSGTSSSCVGAGVIRRFSSLSDAVLAHNQFRKAWQSRKALCMEAVDLLSEGMGKKVKDIVAEMCLETDQEAGVQLPALLPEPPTTTSVNN